MQAGSDANWRLLYRAGGVAALITAVLIPLQIVVFVAWPPPLEGTAIDWFALFQDNWLLGLLSLDLFLIVDYVLLVPIVLALYITLRQISAPLMAVATALYFVAIANRTRPSRCSRSATSTQLRQQAPRELCTWQRGRRC